MTKHIFNSLCFTNQCQSFNVCPLYFCPLPQVSRGGETGSISTWHVTLRCPCAGAQGRWTSMPGTIQNSTRPSTSASPPMSTARRTPTRSDSSCTVRSLQRLQEQLTTTDTKYTMAQVSRVAHTFFCHQPGTLLSWFSKDPCQLIEFDIFFVFVFYSLFLIFTFSTC